MSASEQEREAIIEENRRALAEAGARQQALQAEIESRDSTIQAHLTTQERFKVRACLSPWPRTCGVLTAAPRPHLFIVFSPFPTCGAAG